MSKELMLGVLIVCFILGGIYLATIKEERRVKKGLVKYVGVKFTAQKISQHSSTDHLTHFEFEVEGHPYQRVVNTLQCDRQMRDAAKVINQEMEYVEVYRTSLFNKTPSFHKIEVPFIEQLS